MTWEEERWIIVAVIVVALVIILDELAYWGWKKANPGHKYSHLFGKSELSILDPYRPPTTYYE